MQQWLIWVIVGVLLVAMFVLPLFTRKKQQSQVSTMLSNVAVGDKIKTVGGIIGTVIKVEQVSPVDKEFVIETGEVNKTEIRLDINAIYQIMVKANAPIAEAGETTEEKTEDKAEETVETEVLETKTESQIMDKADESAETDQDVNTEVEETETTKTVTKSAVTPKPNYKKTNSKK